MHPGATWCLGKMAAMTSEEDRTDAVGDVEWFSTRSAARLREATEELVEALRRYTEATTAMHGGSAELPARFAASDAVEAATSRWNEQAFDHTGSFVLALADDQLLDDGEDEYEDEGGQREVVDALSVVTRWDLAVVDADALLAAGRAAHRRNRPEEDEQDAGAAIANPALALAAVLHERGEPWYEVPGVEVGYGVRVYLQPEVVQSEDAVAREVGDKDEVGDAQSDEGPDVLQAVLPPAGRVLFSEDYV